MIEPHLLSKLQTLAAGLHREIALCLRGNVRGDTAVARDFFMPEPEHSSATRSVFHSCPAGTLATWHNHPPRPRRSTVTSRFGPPVKLAPAGSLSGSARLCVLTETDLRTADRLGFPFAVVAVDSETWCWWNLNQVRRAVARPALPFAGQGSWAAGRRVAPVASAGNP